MSQNRKGQTMPVRRIDGGVLTIGAQTLPIEIRINPRARRFILRLGHRRTITVTCPSARHVDDAKRMVEAQRGWIQQQLAAAPDPIELAPGEVLPILGAPRVVVAEDCPRAAARLTAHRILVGGRDRDAMARRIERLLRETVRGAIVTEAAAMAEKLGVTLGTITVRDMTSRWGSCAEDGALSFNWRLVFAPRHILSYVIAHEVAHRREMNHSRAFWREVEKLYPDYRNAAAWLSDEGSALHAYGLKQNAPPAAAA